MRYLETGPRNGPVTDVVARTDSPGHLKGPVGNLDRRVEEYHGGGNTERLRHLKAPTLVLYAIQDNLFSQTDEDTLIKSLQAAASDGGSFWWKEYGKAPADGQQTDFGHNLPWEASGRWPRT